MRSRRTSGVLKLWAIGGLLALVDAIGCGGGSGSGGGASPTTPTPSGGTTITITSSGASPRELTVLPGSRVTFVNNDSRAHTMNSDPHPDHTDCPELNQVGFIQPGQSRQTGNLVETRTCGFHDHDRDSDRSLQGQIIIR